MSTATISPTALALSSTLKTSVGCFSRNLSFFTAYNSNHLTTTRIRTSLGVSAMSTTSVSDPVEVCVKASITYPDKLGDCPFTQRVLLTLEEKHLPYDMKLVDLTKKPEWFLEISPEGKVPVAKLHEKWIADSDIITKLLEEKYPDPSLEVPPEKVSVGSKIFSTFIGFLKSKDPSDGTEQTLLTELTMFNDYIKENGPFINGKEISAADLALAPKLYHMEIALSQHKNWSIPDSLSYLKSYLKEIFSRESFVKTQPLKEDVIAGWRSKVEG